MFDTAGELFLSSHFPIEEGAVFEKKLFVMFFIMFLKETTVKYHFIQWKLNCVVLVFRLKRATVIKEMIDNFFQLQDYYNS